MADWEPANNENTPLVQSQSTTTYHGLLDPRRPYLKWIAVFFMCFLSFGKIYRFKINLKKMNCFFRFILLL